MAIIFTEHTFAYCYVFNHFFYRLHLNSKKAVWTGLDRFLAVRSGFLGSWHNRQPVSVAVRPNRAEKPDRTGPLNTKRKRLLTHQEALPSISYYGPLLC